MSDGERIEADDLPETLRAPLTIPARAFRRSHGPADEGAAADAQLHAARWNHSAVARQLGISRMTLYRRMQRYGIRSPNKGGR